MENHIFIKNMPISARTKNALFQQYGIQTLEELLNIDYQELKETRGLGQVALKEIKEYLHSIQKEFKNEEGPFSSEEKERIEKGERVLKLYGFSQKLCYHLYQQNLFTLDDLIAYGSFIYQNKSLTPSLAQELFLTLKSLDIILENKSNPSMMRLKNFQLQKGESLPLKDQYQELSQIKIQELFDLDYRIRNILKHHHIETITDLIQLDQRTLQSFRYFGEKAVQEIIKYLKKYHLSLALENPQDQILSEKTKCLEEYSMLLQQKNLLQRMQQELEAKILLQEQKLARFDPKENQPNTSAGLKKTKH